MPIPQWTIAAVRDFPPADAAAKEGTLGSNVEKILADLGRYHWLKRPHPPKRSLV